MKTSATASASSSARSDGDLVDVRPGRAQAGAHGVAAGLLDVRVQVDQQRPADHERADVDEQRGGRARPRRPRAAERRSEHERDREGDVERGVRLAFGLLRACLERSCSRRAGAVRVGAALRPARARPAPPPRAAARWRRAPPCRRAPPARSTAGSQKCHSRTASAAVATASKQVQPAELAAPRRGLDPGDHGRARRTPAAPARRTAAPRRRARCACGRRRRATARPSRATCRAG